LSFENQAAVLIALRELQENQKEVLLTLRAEHLNHHGGEVAFPGGKWEPGDRCKGDALYWYDKVWSGLEFNGESR